MEFARVHLKSSSCDLKGSNQWAFFLSCKKHKKIKALLNEIESYIDRLKSIECDWFVVKERFRDTLPDTSLY